MKFNIQLKHNYVKSSKNDQFQINNIILVVNYFINYVSIGANTLINFKDLINYVYQQQSTCMLKKKYKDLLIVNK